MSGIKHGIVYGEPGRFGGWPANNGVWIWGDEILVAFSRGYYKENKKGHSIDRDKPTQKAMARSLDGGESWELEIPEKLASSTKPILCPGGIDFAHPDFAMTCRGSVFYISYDRGKTWQDPYLLPDIGKKLTARTDYLVNGPNECLFFISAKEEKVQAGIQDRAFCARTVDGGRSIGFLAWMTHEPIAVRSVMPATVRCSENHLVSALRRRYDARNSDGASVPSMWLDVYQSNDNGATWEFLSKVASTGGKNGNPPSMVRLRDGRICVAYGYRTEPFGIRARLSSDNGKTWGDEIHLRDDALTWDFGYTRTVQRKDGKLVTMYYYITAERPEQHIAVTIWDPDVVGG